MASRLNPTTFGYQNFYSAVLTGDITSGTLVIGLDTVPTPSSGILVIEPDSTTNREVILYTSKGASTITCPSDGRGFDSSTAVSHLQGSTVIYAPVSKLFSALASGELSTDPLRTESLFDFIASGGIITADSVGVNKNYSIASGVCYINGRRLTITATAAQTVTASKDRYVDLSDNGDGTALITNTEVNNNVASPALAANSIRLGIVVATATTIATTGSINQGQETCILPIASAVPYQVTDSLGNLICPRDPNRKLLGARLNTAGHTSSTSGNGTQIPALSLPVIVPTSRKIKVTLDLGIGLSNATANNASVILFWLTSVGGTQLMQANLVQTPSTSTASGTIVLPAYTPANSSITILASLSSPGGTVATLSASTGAPVILSAELL